MHGVSEQANTLSPPLTELTTLFDRLAARHADLLMLLDGSIAMRETARRIRDVGEFDLSLVGRIETGNQMVHRNWTGTKGPGLHNLVVPEGLGLGGKSIELRRPVWVRDYCESRSITHDFDELVTAEGIRGMLAVPMMYDAELLGAVYVGLRDEVSFGDETIARVQDLAATASMSMVNSHRAEMQTEVALDAERRRMATELHDSVSPMLFRIGAELRSLRSVPSECHILTRIDAVEQQVSQVASVLRDSLAALSEQPSDRQVAVSIQEDCEAFEERTRIPARYVALTDIPDLDTGRGEALRSVVREALVNVEKHAGAATVVVSAVVANGRLTVAIADDGSGLSAGGGDNAGHLGLRMAVDRMQRVGGGLSTVTNDDGGLTVRAWLPCSWPKGADHG